MDIERLATRYPRLFHMAEPGSWHSIRAHGLLSTSATLDLYNVHGAERRKLESLHRPEKVTLGAIPDDTIILRDQKPMAPARLQQALRGGLSASEWYRIINSKVFFWVSEVRLRGLLKARAYREYEHDVLTLESGPLIRGLADCIWLCHMNSGNTFPVPHYRGRDTFKRIPDYPTRRNGNPLKEVVELVVDYEVPNIARFVIDVRRMKNGRVLRRLPVT